ncbi:MAG TPA: TonB-dependent receptor [Vicinamibacterales bacterium]|nr:TonB-dependent receptor [Vicinamibacterales bacterium]HPW19513.1 TonB-dependent receptor [Vicinamibacterales bacterium]
MPTRRRLGPLLVCFAAAILACGAPAWAIEGRVIDRRTGEAVRGAEVTILGRTGAVFTDAEGRFTWRPDPRPPFEVLVILPGERFTRPVLIDALPESGPLIVGISPLVDETVTVTAGAAPDIEATLGSATSFVPARDIVSRQPANLTQALEGVAGVSSVSEGHAAVPAIRGLARGRTLVLIDGARVTSDRRVGPSATFLDPFVLDGVEVARGPGSVAYGSDAFGGVIYARTRRVAPGSPLAVRLVGAVGSGVPQQRAAAEISKGVAKGGFLFQAHARSFDDYNSPAGEVFNSGAADRGFLARGEHQVGRGILSLSWQSDFGRDIERPRTNSRTVRFVYPVEDSHRIGAAYDLRQAGGFERIVLSAFGGRYRQMTDQDRFATASKGRSLERADYAADDFQIRGTAERLAGNARVEFGVDVNGRVGVRATDTVRQYGLTGAVTSDVVTLSIDNARRIDAGAYATLEAALVPGAIVGAGIRADRVSTRNIGGYFGDWSTAHGALSGSASLAVGLGKGLALTGQIGTGFRDPTVSDRYYRGPTGRGFITGNPDLDPERSIQLDAGLRYTSARVRAGLSAFQYRINDLIERYSTSTDYFFFRNRGRARVRGVEAELHASLPGGLELEATGALTRGLALDDRTALDDMPPATITAGLRRAVASRGYVRVRGAFFAKDDRPGPTEIVMPGYTLLDALGGVSLSKSLDLNLSIRNLLDRTYPVSPDARAVLAPGLHGVLTIAARF